MLASSQLFLLSCCGGESTLTYESVPSLSLQYSLPGALGMFALAVGVQQISEVLPAVAYALLSGLNASTVGIVALAAVQVTTVLEVRQLRSLILLACRQSHQRHTDPYLGHIRGLRRALLHCTLVFSNSHHRWWHSHSLLGFVAPAAASQSFIEMGDNASCERRSS